MKRFEFSLERLLRVKRQQERLAELEQRRAQDAAEQARARLDGFRDQLSRISDRYAAAIYATLEDRYSRDALALSLSARAIAYLETEDHA